MSENMKVLEAMMAASKAKDHDAFVETTTDDVEYFWSMHARPIIGKPGLRKFLRNYDASFEQREWSVRNWAEKDQMIMVEGMERLYDRARDVVIDNPFMQVVEFRDGRICSVRDYYDGSKMPPAPKPATKESAE